MKWGLVMAAAVGWTLAAGGAAAQEEPQRCDKLPAPVVKTRQAIHDAAVARDYVVLAKLASAKDFTFSFDEASDPVTYWKSADAEGTDIRATMAALLDMPCVTLTSEDGEPFYEWPRAAEIPYAELTKHEVTALKKLYGADLEQYWFEGTKTGYYVGWRLSIDKDGHWIDFVSGD